MPKQKIKTVQTTSVLIDPERSNWNTFSEQKKIWIYKLENHSLEYEHLYAHIKRHCKFSYYFHSYSPYLLVVTNPDEIAPLIEHFSKPEIFEDWLNPKLIPNWYKALFSDFSNQNKYCVSNHLSKLFLEQPTISKKGNTYAKVLEVEWSHSYHISQALEAGTRENEHLFWLKDRVTRLKKYTAEKDEKNIRYWHPGKLWVLDPLREDNVFLFQEILREEVKEHEAKGVYFEDTDEDFRSEMPYISLLDADAFERTRLKKLYDLQQSFMAYLQNLGLAAEARKIEMQQIIHKAPKLPFTPPTSLLNIQDARYLKTTDFETIQHALVQKISTLANWASIVSVDSSETEQASKLMVLDHTQKAYEDLLKNEDEEDQYKLLKQRFKAIPTQGFCINENDQQYKLARKSRKFIPDRAERKQKYFQYPLPDFNNKDWVRNLEIVLQQLYLKDLLLRDKPINKVFPNFEKLKGWCFLTHKTLLHITDTLNLYSLSDPQVDNIIKAISGDDLNSLNALYMQYVFPYRNVDRQRKGIASDHVKIMFSSEHCWLIQEVDERAFYEMEIAARRFNDREKTKKNTLDFLLPEEAQKLLPKANLEAYNALIKNIARDSATISYKELKTQILTKNAEGKIGAPLFVQNETPWVQALNQFKGMELKGMKSDGIFDTAQGIWFDQNSGQYLVGGVQGFNKKQEKGIQMRKVRALKGNFDPEFFFSLLDVGFIRHKGYTVVPFPFALAKMAKKEAYV